MGITMEQIAQIAGVHRSTVDKVLHNRPGISEPVRNRIQALLREYDYQANPAGIALRRQGTPFRMVTVLPVSRLSESIRRGIEEKLKAVSFHHFEMEFVYPGEAFTDSEKGGEQTASPDGMIIMASPRCGREVAFADSAGIPFVLVGSGFPNLRPLCRVHSDETRSGRLAGHLMGLFTGGSGQTAYLTSSIPEIGSAKQKKLRPFPEYLRTNYPGMEVITRECGPDEPEAIARCTLQLLREYPALRVIYCDSEDACLAGAALKESFRAGEIVFISRYANPEIIELIREGAVTCAVSGEMNACGQMAADVLINRLLFKRNPPFPVVTTDNIVIKETIKMLRTQLDYSEKSSIILLWRKG